MRPQRQTHRTRPLQDFQRGREDQESCDTLAAVGEVPNVELRLIRTKGQSRLGVDVAVLALGQRRRITEVLEVAVALADI